MINAHRRLESFEMREISSDMITHDGACICRCLVKEEFVIDIDRFSLFIVS